MSRFKFYALSLAAASVIFGGSFMLKRLLDELPPIHALEDYTPALMTRLFDAKGEVIAELSIEKRALLTLGQIPVDMQNAVIAIEDDRFFKHWGVSPRGIVRAAIANFLARRVVQGASTITQQLSKQIFLTRERTLARKIREVLLSIQIEHNFSKTEILQLYLNQIYFGEGAYGVQSAARIFFDKEVSELTLADCTLLAGLIKAPNGYSPFRRAARSKRRRSVVLQRMLDLGMISAQERKTAEAVPVPLNKPPAVETQAPFFVEHIRRRLERKYGYNRFWRGGLNIYTTLDLKMQRIAEKVMAGELAKFDVEAGKLWAKKQKAEAAEAVLMLEEGEELEEVVISTIPPANIQAAFTVLDVKTGAIRVMIGGRESHFNRVTQAKRQPGSTFKPFVWAAALEAGMTAASLVEDIPLAFYYDGRDWRLLEGATDLYSINMATAPFADSPDFKIWVPNNFDSKFLGQVTLRRALAKSRNIASVNLITQIGPPLVVELAHKTGIYSRLQPVPALGLGASVVTPLEITSAFATFANGGIRTAPFTVARVEDKTGRILQSHIPSEKVAISPQLAYLVTNLLKGVVQAGTGRRAKRLRRPIAGKTGTTNDNRDLWFIGFTPDLVAMAWMGYDELAFSGARRWTGGGAALPWWVAIMGEILKDYPKRDFPVPRGIVFEKIDADTGLLALPTCPRKNKLLEAFIEGTEPTEYCEVDHSLPPAPPITLDPALGPQPAGPPPMPVPVEMPPADPDALPTDEELRNLPPDDFEDVTDQEPPVDFIE